MPRGLGLLLAVLEMIAPSVVHAAQAAHAETSTEPVITDIGPHHRRWTRQQVLQLPNGRTRTNVTSYVELQTGLNVLGPDGRWSESDPSFRILPDGSGAVAHRSLHQVAIAANLNTLGAISVHTPEGKRLVLHVLGLAWYDAATGRSQMFAQVQDSIGELHGTDTVLFRDAFHGVAADVRYMNRRDGFEQDIVLLQGVTPPRDFNEETTRIEVWNEFLEAPAALLTQRARAGMTDDTVDWGAMQTGPGRAFLLGEDRRTAGAHVAKRWVTTADQRSFLVEAVRYPSAKRALDQLPARQAAVNPPAGAAAGAVKDLAKVEGFNGERPFPAAPKPRLANSTDRFRTAAIAKPAPPGQRAATGATTDLLLTPPVPVASAQPAVGYVIDYDLQSSLTNHVLACDSTVFVTGPVNFHGSNNVIEGGVVIKFSPTNTAQLNFNTAPIWATGPYRPAICTARDDDSIGTPIAGSTGSPSGWYGGAFLNLSANATGAHLRVSYARTAVRFSDVSLTLRHAQFVHCSNVVEKTGDWLSAPLIVENALAYDSAVFLRGQCFLTGRHLTVHECGQLVAAEETASATLNNSILADMDEEGSTILTLNYSYNGSANGIFQTVGAAAHYLANGSPHRNAGNANLNSTALNNERKLRTTYPPVVIDINAFHTQSLTLGVQAQRDTDTPDLGYLYDPLDFALRGILLTNATITVLPGTALAMVRGGGTLDCALALFGGARFICEGTPASLNHLVAQQMVQEQANTNWPGPVHSVRTAWLNSTEPVLLRARFTHWALPAGGSVHLGGAEGAGGSVFLRDCQLQGGYVDLGRQTFAATNSLFHRVNFYLHDYFGTYTVGHALRHNTLIGAELLLDHWSADAWPVDNNLFVGTAMSDWGGVAPVPGHNGYVTNDVCLPLAGGVSNVVLSSVSFDEGALGRFYLPTNGPATNLFNAGSTNAHLLALWHFTTTTNNVKETNSMVDIGFHAIAVDANGLPVDTDGDGLADWIEDFDGDGTFDSGETGWLTQTDTDGDGVDDYIETLLGRNPLVAATTNDVTGVLNLRRYTPLK